MLALVILIQSFALFQCGKPVVCGYDRARSRGPYKKLTGGICHPGYQVDKDQCLAAAKSVGADKSKTNLDGGDDNGGAGTPGGCTIHRVHGNVEWWGVGLPKNDGSCGDYDRDCVCSQDYELLRSGYCPLDLQVSQGFCLDAAKQVGSWAKDSLSVQSDGGGPGGCTLHQLGDVEWWGVGKPKNTDECGAYSRYCVCRTASDWDVGAKDCPVAFANPSELQASPWGTYYKAVYGSIPNSGYPINPLSIWMLYDDQLDKAGVHNAPISVGACLDKSDPDKTPEEHQRFVKASYYQPPGVSWMWHPYPYPALTGNSWQEVIHQADPFGDEHFGTWFIYAPGSGIFFNVGNTKSFPEHEDAYKFFGVAGGQVNEVMSQKAASAGYDSVQFLAHKDHINYPCDRQAGLDYMGLEIVGVKLVGTHACGSSTGRSPSIRAGWRAAVECVCDNGKKFLNCQAVPNMAAEMNYTVLV